MTDPQQPPTTPDQGSVPPPPPAPAAANPWDLPTAGAPQQAPVAPTPPAPEAAAPAEPAPFVAPTNPYVTQPGNPYAPQGGNPYVTPTPNPYAPQQPAAPAGAPVPPGQQPPAPDAASVGAPSAPAAHPYAGQTPEAPNPYAQQTNPYAAQPAAPSYAAPGAYAQAPGQPAYAQPAYGYAPQQQPSRLNVLGLVATILGGLGLLIGLVPFVGFFGSLLALVGVILGIIGAVSKTKPRLLGIIGAALSGLALLLSILISTWAIITLVQTVETANDWQDDYTSEEYYGDTAPEVSGTGAGTLDDPAAIGDTLTFFDFSGDPEWEAVVGAPVFDATADVLAAESYNPEPQAGFQYVLVPLELTSVGTVDAYASSFDPWFIDNVGDGHTLSYVTYPDDLYSFDVVAPGETIVVNLVFEVPTDGVTGSALEVGTFSTIDPVYIALD